MIRCKVDGKDAILYKGKPLPDKPKTYKELKVVRHSLGNMYNSNILTLFEARDKTLRFEIYRDGCFYPFYGKIEFI